MSKIGMINKNVKKIFVTIFCLLALLPVTAKAANSYAPDLTAQMQATAEVAQYNTVPNDPRLVVANIIQIILGMLGIITVGFVVYAGFLILFSAGEEEKISKGKNVLKTSIIGLVIILSAYGMAYLVEKVITGNYFAQCSNGVCTEVKPPERTNSDPYAQDFYPGEKTLFQPTDYQGPVQ